MRIAVSDEDVEEYIGIINQIAQDHPILVDKYLMGKEIEVDAVCDLSLIHISCIQNLFRITIRLFPQSHIQKIFWDSR